MKVMVMFDLPTINPSHRLAYVRFRKRLFQLGFEPFQESVYVKECDTQWDVKMITRVIGNIVPAEGKVTTCNFSDRQWAETRHYEDGEKIERRDESRQVVMIL